MFCRYMQHVSEIRVVELIPQSVCCRQLSHSDVCTTTRCSAHFTAGCWRIGQFLSVQIWGHLKISVIAAYWTPQIYIDYKAVKTSLTGWDQWQVTTQWSPWFVHKESEKTMTEQWTFSVTSRRHVQFRWKWRQFFGSWEKNEKMFFFCSFRDIPRKKERNSWTENSSRRSLTNFYICFWLALLLEKMNRDMKSDTSTGGIRAEWKSDHEERWTETEIKWLEKPTEAQGEQW